MELSPAKYQASCNPLIHCVWDPHGYVGKYREVCLLQQESQEHKRTKWGHSLCSGDYYVCQIHTLAVSILANDLLQGMTDKHFPTSPRFYWACICCPVPFPIDLWGTDRENVRLQLQSTNSRPILSDLTFTPFLLINNKVITTVLISFLYFLHYQL